MSRRSHHRCLTAFLVVVSLLFSQLALAKYVCPGSTDMVAMAEMMAAGEPCEGMDTAQPVLCHQYAVGASLAVDQVQTPTLSLPALVSVFYLPPLDVSADARGMPVSAEPDVHPPPDPLFLSTLRLRV